MREHGTVVSRNSDLFGVASLLLTLATPILFALSWTVVGNASLEILGAVIFFGSIALAIVVIATGRRGQGAAIAALAVSVPIAFAYCGITLFRMMIEH